MSGSFEGFSEDDIRKINSSNKSTSSNNSNGKVKLQQGFSKPYIKAVRRGNSQKSQYLTKSSFTKMEPVLENAKLSKSESNTVSDNSEPPNSTENYVTECVDNKHPIPENNATSPNILEPANALLSSQRKIDLEEFQVRQKLMEEQNRKRKELLAKLLEVKTKQTKEEAERLNEIKEELRKLDMLLSNDVNILRQQIEVASLEYMEVQKKYFKIEKDFLEAKVILHQKLERKELLTEHLCSIIEKNEERKAKKLTELLEKLNVNADTKNHEELNGAVDLDGSLEEKMAIES